MYIFRIVSKFPPSLSECYILLDHDNKRAWFVRDFISLVLSLGYLRKVETNDEKRVFHFQFGSWLASFFLSFLLRPTGTETRNVCYWRKVIVSLWLCSSLWLSMRKIMCSCGYTCPLCLVFHENFMHTFSSLWKMTISGSSFWIVRKLDIFCRI